MVHNLGPSPFGHPFWEPFTGVGEPAKCLDEWTIIEMSKLIRAKNDWKVKYRDETIASRWRAELRGRFTSRFGSMDELIEYVFRELAWYEYVERNFEGLKESGFVIGCDDKIVCSDRAVPADVQNGLRAEVERFAQAEFGNTRDYHPGTSKQVVDLVHPSLYPFQYGVTPQTRTRTRKQKRGPADTPPEQEVFVLDFSDRIGTVKHGVDAAAISRKYQWLPALMDRKPGRGGPDGDSLEHSYHFVSYINNLDPDKHSRLYGPIARVFNLALPGLNYTLSRLATGSPRRIRPPLRSYYTQEYHDKLREVLADDDNDEDAIAAFVRTKLAYLKERPLRYTRDHPVNYDFDLRKTFEKLRVIVKLANIELTPASPRYNGGSWHVEGTVNEDIVATVVYYYDSSNVTESRLSFRGAFEPPAHEQDDTIGCEAIFGIKHGETLTRMVGDVECKEGRVVVFPNWFQHRVEPFELEDATKSGHRKILCMHVCDPYNDRVVSTASVPPQQKSWYEGPLADKMLASGKLEKIVEVTGDTWPIGLHESRTVREELMKERSIVHSEEGWGPFYREFTLYEH